MAQATSSDGPTVIYDLDEDFFERFNLKKGKILGKGMAGEVYLVSSLAHPERHRAVKIYSLADDVRERNLRHFYTEAGVGQVS